MEEMSEQDRQTGDAARARRKRVAERTIRVLGLVVGFLWLLIFLTVLRTGYLSSTGIALGALLVMTYLVAPVVGLAGKKRLEKLLSWLWVGTIILFVLAAIMAYLWPGGGGTWHPYRFDDELAAIEAKRAAPDAENAALRYEAVLAGMDLDDEPDFVFSGSSLRDEPGQHPWRAKEYPLASAWLDSQSATIGRLLEIGRMEKCRWPVQADTYDEYTVPYKKLRRSMLLLVAVGNRDLGEDRVTDALTKYFRALRIADHIHQQPSMVDCLTSFGCERDGLRMIRYALVQSNLSDENIAEIAKHLPPAADPWLEEWERLLEHEKLHYMNLLGRLYEVNADGAVRFAAQPLISAKGKDGKRTSRFPRLYWLISMPRDPHAVRGLADKYFAKIDQCVNAAPLPPMNKARQFDSTSLTGFSKVRCNSLRWLAETWFFNEQEYIQHRQHRIPAITMRRGTWLLLGLRRYRDAHGAWPQTLDAISEYVPAEAFSDPTTGEAFIYGLDGDNFKLYSKGPNRIDEGGRRRYVKALKKSEDDISIWPPPVPEPRDESTDDEMLKQMEEIYGKEYMETLRKDQGSDKR